LFGESLEITLTVPLTLVSKHEFFEHSGSGALKVSLKRLLKTLNKFSRLEIICLDVASIPLDVDTC